MGADLHPAPVVPDEHLLSLGDAPGLGVLGMHPQCLGIDGMHRLIIVVDGVTAALGVPADELEGILFPQGVARSFRRVHIPGDGGHEVPELGLPDLGGEQLHLAAGGGERVMVDVPPLVGKGDTHRRVLIAVDARLFERLIIRQLRLLAPEVLVAPLQPLSQCTAFGELGPQADLLRHLAQPVVLKPSLVQRLDDLVVEAHKVPVLPGLGDVLPSNMETPGSSTSANLALAVIKRSLHTMNSHLEVSRRIAAVRLMSPCWLIRQLPARFKIILMSLCSCSPPVTPSSSVSSWPRTTASVHRYVGISMG